jgi:hypothetical protein
MEAHTCHPSYMGSKGRKIMVQADSGINVRLFEKYLKQKGLGV